MIFRKYFLMDTAGGAAAGGGGAPAAGAGGAAGAMGAPPAAGAGGGAGGAPAGGTATDWTTGLSDDLRGYAQTKGFKDVGAVVESYRNFEKLRGVPAERLLTLPEKLDDATAMGDVFKKLGRPDNAEGYAIKIDPGFGDEKFASWAKGTFHELGLSKAQGEKLVAKWNDHMKGGLDAKTREYTVTAERQEATLRSEWGAAYDQNVTLAGRAAAEVGITGDQIDQLEQVMGYDGVIKMLHGIGSKFSEGSFVGSGSGGGAGGGGAMTPDRAKSEIAALRSDPAFIAKYTSGDAEAAQRMAVLHKWAHPSA